MSPGIDKAPLQIPVLENPQLMGVLDVACAPLPLPKVGKVTYN